jgi:hypothetical protein
MWRINSHKASYRQHRIDTGNYIMDKHNIKPKTNYMQALEGKHINTEKLNKQTNKDEER